MAVLHLQRGMASGLCLPESSLRSWLPPLQSDPLRPDCRAADSVQQGWHAELRHENRISGRERFARVQLLRRSENHSATAAAATASSSYFATPALKCGWWIRVGDVAASAAVDAAASASASAPSSPSPANDTRDLGWTHMDRLSSTPNAEAEALRRCEAVCADAVMRLTGQSWASLRAREEDAAAGKRDANAVPPAKLVGKFELASEFAASRAAATRSTEEQHARLAGRSPAGALSSIAWQLVLQHCDTGDALCLAATCKRIAADASHPFAWKHARVVRRIKADVLRRCEGEHPWRLPSRSPTASPPSPRRPSAFVPVHLDLLRSAATKGIVSVVDSLPSWARLAGVSVGSLDAGLNHSHWAPMLQCTQAQSVRVLEVHDSLLTGRYEVERLLQLLPALERLRVDQHKCSTVIHDTSSKPGFICHAMREITFVGLPHDRTLRILMACPKLQRCTFEQRNRHHNFLHFVRATLPGFFPRQLSDSSSGAPPTLRILAHSITDTPWLHSLLQGRVKEFLSDVLGPPSSTFLPHVEFVLIDDEGIGNSSASLIPLRRSLASLDPDVAAQISCWRVLEHEAGTEHIFRPEQRL